jgi:PAS domain S-box-containing protein
MRKLQESGLQADFVERLLDASDDCIKILDLDARLMSMSPNGQRALAIMNFATVEGADWLSFWNGNDKLAAESAVKAARRGERGRFLGYLAVEGRDRWWDVTVTPILGSGGEPEQLLAVSRNVTENVEINRALSRSEQRYRLLGEALPGVYWTATPDGMLDDAKWIPGRLPPAERMGDAWLRSVHPDDVERVRARWRASVETGELYEATFRVLMTNGPFRWQLVRALPQRDSGGAIIRWVGMNIDVDDQRRADEAREKFVRLVEASDDLIGIVDERGNATFVNEAGRKLLGIGTLEDARTTRLGDYFMPDDRAFVEAEIAPAVARDGRWLGDLRMRHFGTGEQVAVSFNAFSLFDEAGKTVGMAMVGRDLRERRRYEIGMRSLAEMGAAMYGSLDLAGTLRNVAGAVIRGFASYCIIDVLEADGSVRSFVAHCDPSRLNVLQRAADYRNSLPEHPASLAFRHGTSTLLARMSPEWLGKMGHADAGLLDARSVIWVPIRSTQEDAIVAVLTCVLDGTDPRGSYREEDLRFAEEIAVRAGLALYHARAYEREQRIAVTLQEASLPRTLPTHDRIFLSAAYRPGNREATIGGDWYDAFVLSDGRIAITVGDVLGNGLAAAVTMGKVRQAMRSVASLIPTPTAMLDVADHTVREESSDLYATAVAGIYDPRTSEFTFASAGHPGPLRRDPQGRIDEFNAPGLLLGMRERGQATTVTIAAPPGSQLVFFTDGLVEATHDIAEGYRRVYEAIENGGIRDTDAAADALVENVLRGEAASDDIAVLVAEIGPRTNVRRAWILPARFGEVTTARHAIRALLATTDASEDAAALAELAVGELVANAVRYGSGSTVGIAFEVSSEGATLSVTNDGAPFERPAVDLRHVSLRGGGRGLAMLVAFGCTLSIDREDPQRCAVTVSIPFE